MLTLNFPSRLRRHLAVPTDPAQGLRASGLTVVTSGGARLLKDVSLELRAGELVAVVGPNGAGKSTLLKALAGDLPTAWIRTGRVEFGGRPLHTWPRRDRARRLGVLPQQMPVPFAFTALETVLLGRSPHGDRETAADRTIARQALAAAGVEHLAERLCPTLSGGEAQRVGFARVLAQLWPSATPRAEAPRYLLLDEPTASLDLARQHELLSVARAWASEGNVGVLAILHDLNLAARYADRLLVLDAGRPRGLGPPADLLTPALLQDTFGLPTLVQPHPTRGHPVVTCA